MKLILRTRDVLLALSIAACTSSRAPAGPDANAADGSARTGSGGMAGTVSSGSTGGAAAGRDAAVAGGAAPVDSGSSQAGGPPPEICTDQVGSCPAHSFGIWQVLLDAMDFGADARLLAMAGQDVLVAVGDGTFRVVQLGGPYEDSDMVTTYSSWEFPSGDQQPIAIAAGGDPPDILFVVACDEAAKRCSLWRSDVSQGALTPWLETELPSGFSPRGVTLDPAVSQEAICIHGNGMLCLENGGWQEAITPSPDFRLNAVALGPLWSLAVGDHGRWFKRERDDSGALGVWQEQTPLGDTALTHVSVGGAGGVITGEGKIQAALGEQAQLFRCPAPSDQLVALMLNPRSPAFAYAITSTGQVLVHAQLTRLQPEPYCAYQQLMLPGIVIETGKSPCIDADNPRVLTERLLFGANVCIFAD